MFIIMYPLGVIGELMTIYAALPYVRKAGMYSLRLPNKYNVSFDYYYFLIIAMLSYIPLFPQLYFHMLRQRRRVLHGEVIVEKDEQKCTTPYQPLQHSNNGHTCITTEKIVIDIMRQDHQQPNIQLTGNASVLNPYYSHSSVYFMLFHTRRIGSGINLYLLFWNISSVFLHSPLQFFLFFSPVVD